MKTVHFLVGIANYSVGTRLGTPACLPTWRGWYIVPSEVTRQLARVTCGTCKRTRAYRAALEKAK